MSLRGTVLEDSLVHDLHRFTKVASAIFTTSLQEKYTMIAFREVDSPCRPDRLLPTST